MHAGLFARPRLTIAMAIAVLLLSLLPVAASAQEGGFYQQRNLVSDLPNFAQFRDKSLVNPWGLSHSPDGPWQVPTSARSALTCWLAILVTVASMPSILSQVSSLANSATKAAMRSR